MRLIVPTEKGSRTVPRSTPAGWISGGAAGLTVRKQFDPVSYGCTEEAVEFVGDGGGGGGSGVAAIAVSSR